jgi:ectoine hydroxylase-related dioxygenase (phytanoyl-CoA dioxygenase family)
MLAVRISLDDCGPDNGPLRVLPGTHRDGLLSRTAVVQLQGVVEEEVCVLNRGGVVLMKPLLLHASSAAVSPSHRRVLHLEFARPVLPTGLAFYRW